MRTIKYKNCYGIGISSDSWENIPLEKFILLVPSLGYSISIYQIIPPLAVLNDFFTLGEVNSGMSGHWIWKVFTIKRDEYKDLVEIIYTDPKLNINMREEFLYPKITKYKAWNKLMFSNYAKNKCKR